MAKVMALDLGDQWIGSALSDISRMFVKPYKTIKADELKDFLNKTIAEEKITEIVIGYPKTMRGTESDQTKKVVEQKKELEALYPQIKFILWDERLSSKRAQNLKSAKNKEDKLKSHSIAAAFILDSYISFLNLAK